MSRIQNIVTILVGVAVVWWLLQQVLGLLGSFADVLAIFGFAWLLNLLLEPMVDRLYRHGVPRITSWGIGYICVLLALVLLTLPLASQVSALPTTLPGAIERATSQVDVFFGWLRDHRVPVPESVQLLLEDTAVTQQIGSTVLAWSLAVFSVGGQTLLVIGVAAAMSVGDSSLRRLILAALPPRWFDRAQRLYDDVRRTYSAAIRAQLGIWALGMLLSLGAMALFNTPGMLLWIGPLAVIRLIPYLGGILGGLLTIIILLLSLPWPVALIPVILVIIGQNLMGYLIEPILLGRVLQLSPGLVLFVVLVGWKIGGITGIAFGVPAVAVVQAFADRLVSRREQPPSDQHGSPLAGRAEEAVSVPRPPGVSSISEPLRPQR